MKIDNAKKQVEFTNSEMETICMIQLRLLECDNLSKKDRTNVTRWIAHHIEKMKITTLKQLLDIKRSALKYLDMIVDFVSNNISAERVVIKKSGVVSKSCLCTISCDCDFYA